MGKGKRRVTRFKNKKRSPLFFYFSNSDQSNQVIGPSKHFPLRLVHSRNLHDKQVAITAFLVRVLYTKTLAIGVEQEVFVQTEMP
jgi:hypothetical protein